MVFHLLFGLEGQVAGQVKIQVSHYARVHCFIRRHLASCRHRSKLPYARQIRLIEDYGKTKTFISIGHNHRLPAGRQRSRDAIALR